MKVDFKKVIPVFILCSLAIVFLFSIPQFKQQAHAGKGRKAVIGIGAVLFGAAILNEANKAKNKKRFHKKGYVKRERRNNNTYKTQKALRKLGYYRGPLDGVSGSGTKKAIASYFIASGETAKTTLTEDERAILIARSESAGAPLVDSTKKKFSREPSSPYLPSETRYTTKSQERKEKYYAPIPKTDNANIAAKEKNQ